MSARLTPWFDGDVRPVRVGVYERQIRIWPVRYCLWTGEEWRKPDVTAAAAAAKSSPSGYQPTHSGSLFKWRGLAADPEGV